MTSRDYTAADHLLLQFDQALRTVFGKPHLTERPDPAAPPNESK